ncbi:hypothetical protein M8G38_12810 [Providencia stuartii]|uniref:hypothetical protein n=1 Tax=Providencia stuartii TaxID=588 RepID=UPI00201DBADE|nr:hypothetical protein [Providencia stuartii]UQZ10679.1 hypothetical protein M8G38_12810 [Providencia stuartii]
MRPIPKSEELMLALQERIIHEDVSNDFELMQVLREIDKHSSALEKNHLKALAYSLNNQIEKASEFFELSLQVKNLDYARNYLAVINQRSTNTKLYNLLKRFSDEYESLIFSKLAYQSSLNMADLKKAEYFTSKLVKLSADEDRDAYIKQFEKAKGALLTYCFMSGLNEDELMKLANIIIAILDGRNIRIAGINYANTSAHDSQANLYMVTTECDDVDLLADINIELAYNLAEHEEFIGKNFSVFIGGVDNISALKERQKWL